MAEDITGNSSYITAINLIQKTLAEKATKLDLSRLSLRQLPPEIGQLTNLRELNLVGNKLSGLPPEIVQLINLRELNIGFISLSNLPPEIVQLTNLQSLNLTGNLLQSLPPEIGPLSVFAVSINISFNSAVICFIILMVQVYFG